MDVIRLNHTFPELVMGRALVLKRIPSQALHSIGVPEQDELVRYLKAKAILHGELQKEAEEEALITIHDEILNDPSLQTGVESNIREKGMLAVDAVSCTCREIMKMFDAIDDEYFKSRKEDVRDIELRLRSILNGETPTNFSDFPQQTEPYIVVANEFFLSDMLKLNAVNLKGIITAKGSATSHVAISAKNKGIPIFFGMESVVNAIVQDDYLIVDGEHGVVFSNPTADLREKYEYVLKQNERNKQTSVINRHVVTAKGTPVAVYANVGDIEELKMALAYGADGIGLFRTELLFMRQFTDFPDEEAQFAVYREAAQTCGDKPLIIRTLDIGGDKALPYFQLPQEENPFLGWRSIRISLTRTDLFKVQLRALLRASAFGNIRLMFPMITSLHELTRARTLLTECCAELEKEEIAYNPQLKVGVMIETPAAVFIATTLAKEVDFFSIGTNDLTQYIMAADRGNPHVADLCSYSQPAVLIAIEQTIAVAKAAEIEVEICGEMASDTSMTEPLFKMGLRTYSVALTHISTLKQSIEHLEL